MADDDQFGGPDSFIDSLYDDLDDDSDDGHGAAQLHRKGRNESSDTNNDDRDMSNRERHGDAGISVRKKQKTDQNQNSFTRRANDAEEEGEEDGKGGRHSYDDDDDDDEQQQQLEEEEEEPRSSLIERLQDENKCLKRNISILFRTAKNELQRKDDQVRRLQEEVDSLRRQRQRLDGQQQRPSHQQTSGGSSVTSIDDRGTINLLPYDNAVSSNADSIESGRRSSR